MKILLAHAGKQHSYHVAKAMYDLGILEKFVTSSYIRNPGIQKYLSSNNNTFWTRRFIDDLPGKYIESNWRFEIKEATYLRLFGKNHKTSNAVFKRDQNFDNYLSKKIRNYKDIMYWGFQGSSLLSLKAARENEIPAIVELSSVHITLAKKIISEEIMLNPEWADSMENLVYPLEYEKRLEEEPHVADFVVAASEFTKQSLIDSGVSESKIFKLPLGFDISKLNYKQSYTKREGKLRILFAGSITQLKGIKYLLDVVKQLKNDVNLTMVGNIQGSGKALKKYASCFEHIPGVSQQEIFRMYENYDVLVLPSVFEGFGLVILEAMACGLPVIATPNTIGPELIREGKNGYIIPIRDVDSLRSAIASILNKSDSELMEMKEIARQSALSYSWEEYKTRLHRLCFTLNEKALR